MERVRSAHRRLGWLVTLAVATACGCQTVRTPESQIAASNIPREFTKTSMPDYVVEPPDLIRIEVLEALPGRPVTGERLVRPDGKVSLDFYGDLFVAGLTTDEIKEKVIIHLRKFIPDATLGLVEVDPETGKVREIAPRDSDRVFVEVTSYNSKFYYVMGDVNAPGRLPITGNETVLDAINNVGGLAPTASVNDIRLVRPAPPGSCCDQFLPVNYAAIAYGGDPTTNYQLLPGDRLVIYRDPIVRTTVLINRLAEPFQTTLSAILFYSFTAQSVKNLYQFGRTGQTPTAPLVPRNPNPLNDAAR
jgi:polysaccharide export outer membrane protein